MYQSGRAMTSEQLKERIKLLNVMGIALPVFFVAGAAAFFVYAFFAESMLLILLAGVLPCMVFAVFAVGLVRAAKRNVFKDYMAALGGEGKSPKKGGEVFCWGVTIKYRERPRGGGKNFPRRTAPFFCISTAIFCT